MTLERSGCFGHCPVYKLTLRDDGSATYIGYSSVPKIGTFVAQINFWSFLDIVEPYDPWSLKDDVARCKDAPTLTITMARGSETRSVHLDDCLNVPARFMGTVAAMDGFAAYIPWTPQSVASDFPGTYLNLENFSVLDEMTIAPDGDGTMRASRVRATSESCEALLNPTPVALGALIPESGSSDTVRMNDGSELRLWSGAQKSAGSGVEWRQGGKSTTYLAVNRELERMIGSLFEQNAMKPGSHLSCCPCADKH